MSERSFRMGIWDGAALSERPPIEWLVPGYLAAGKVTLLTSLWKSGKTTLLSLLLARRHQGGTLAGLSVRVGKTALISEEEEDLWAERRRRLNFGGNVCFFCQPFDRRPTFDQWVELLDHLLELRRDHGVDLVAIDTLSPFLPARNENVATIVQEALQPLRKLTRAGVSILAAHHPRKGAARLGESARGSGAFAGFADICIEMGHPGGDPFTRRRRLHGLSRFAQTPRRLLIELNADATDYTSCEDTGDDFHANWDVLLMVLEDAHHPLTRREILEEWPTDFPKPSEQSLWRWLNRAVELSLAHSEGTGKKNDPFRYWLPIMEEKWKTDPAYQTYRNQQWINQALDAALRNEPPPPAPPLAG